MRPPAVRRGRGAQDTGCEAACSGDMPAGSGGGCKLAGRMGVGGQRPVPQFGGNAARLEQAQQGLPSGIQERWEALAPGASGLGSVAPQRLQSGDLEMGHLCRVQLEV